MQHRGIAGFDSLERKLPLLIGGLVAVMVLATLLVTYHELRQSARATAVERLSRVSDQLGDLVGASLHARAAAIADAADDRAITALLAGAADDDSRARELLATAQFQELPVELHDAAGRLVLRVGDAPADGERLGAPATAARPALPDSVTHSPLYVENGVGLYWVSAPVRHDGRLVGHLHVQRAAGSRSAGEQIEQLLGGDIEIQFTNADGGPWIGLDGTATTGAAAVAATGEPFQRDRPDGAAYAFARELPGTPWLIIAEVPVDVALASAGAAAGRVLVLGIVLLLVGGLLAWLVSRRVTAPLRRLGTAADAIAAGDYTRRAGLSRTDEIGHVARSFDHMVERVERTHAELAERFEEARSLAAELETANARLQQAVAEIEAARLDAQQASSAKSEFLATMSHEIRTPINAIIGYADLLDLGVPGTLTEQQQQFMVRIRRSGEHLISLVNDVLDFAKLESGQLRVARDIRSAGAAMEAAVTMMHGPAAAKGIELRVNCPAEALYLGDAQRLQQILLNLLSNAIKFSDAASTVELVCERRRSRAVQPLPDTAAEQSWTCITVVDSGPGIAADLHERIFEPFVQVASGYTRAHGGAGLGLAISRSLARVMGGDLTVDSAPGRGSRFTVWLPHPATADAVAA